MYWNVRYILLYIEAFCNYSVINRDLKIIHFFRFFVQL